MSGKILARASAISLSILLAACGGDDSSSSLAGTGSEGDGGSGDGSSGGGEQTVSLELGTGSGSGFQSGQMNASATNLSSGGSTRLEFNVVNASAGNSIYNSVETSVTISSLCQNAVFDTPITTTSGSFSTTYEAGCAGTDTITARLPNGSTATANVNVAAPEIGELEFLTVTPDSIALSGSSTSGRPSVSDVTFQLNDKNGNPITTGEGIAFTLSTTVGGISLSQASTETDENGVASTRVNAGTVATVVSVTATYTPDTGPVIQTTSAPISISATIPDQDSFSLSVEENFLPNARNYDGVSVPITIRAADRNNNRISDAVVNFVTNSGSVQSECILQDGACSIEWISQNPRADDGVALILARTVGEESFRDLNSDGKYVQSEDDFNVAQNDLGEAFLDRNRNGNFDSGEEYFDYNSNGQYDPANGIYNGTACTDTSGVECTTSLLEITRTGKLFLASDNIQITFTTTVQPGQVCAEIAGVFTNDSGATIEGPPPGGTDIAFSTTNGSVVAPSSFSSPTSYRETPVERCVTVEGDGTSSTGTFTVEVTPPAPYNSDPFVAQAAISD
ncbi:MULTISPECIES: Ig-like domain-containing protein [Marinobacter]|jgi:hypothetical protein|uniref:Ig-like domain-containing protein n=1 Tax=Marinobacter TaxID=2742 RepID=UPI000ABF35FE|nr:MULTISPECIES: Ig-like domain-containing protein [Marinobacter]MDC8457463.1 hypothetical protein [Marinobacter sp. DS40M6]MDM8181706.1 Ig-like domain-containing protein [Marinobacter salarius]RUT76589.1 hypothetical protein EHM94_16135 [Marinobacter sp. NP-6]|tara:strand:- start:132 stop:1829 length:1698 start_codon:yes stop_codon:yes gene_type:complete